jgi:hypothetical protein
MAGEKFSIAHCAAAVYPDSNSVTIWFNESPITLQEAEAFQNSAYADSSKGGKERTMLLVAFCPGGGKATAARARSSRSTWACRMRNPRWLARSGSWKRRRTSRSTGSPAT